MLTSKQKELLMLIQARLQETGVPPSFDEMKEALDLKSKSGIRGRRLHGSPHKLRGDASPARQKFQSTTCGEDSADDRGGRQNGGTQNRGMLGREYVLSYRTRLEENEKIISGKFWEPSPVPPGGDAEISIEELMHDELGLTRPVDDAGGIGPAQQRRLFHSRSATLPIAGRWIERWPKSFASITASTSQSPMPG